MKSIYFKNFLATAVMVLVSFLMIGVAFVFIGQGYVIKSHRESMEQNAKTVTRLVVSMLARHADLYGEHLGQPGLFD